MEIIEFKGVKYPAFQTNGNAARFCRQFALEVCKGDIIYDIGYGKKEWQFPNSIGVDLLDGNEYHAKNLPPFKADAIHSSHLLEHLENWTAVLDYWHSKLKDGGILFMYLPNMLEQKYWRNWHNRKHVTWIEPNVLKLYFEDKGEMWNNVFVSGSDLYNSFCVVAEKISGDYFESEKPNISSVYVEFPKI